MNGQRPIGDSQWQTAFDKLVKSSADRGLIVGRLGVKTSSSSADLAVITRPGYYYVSIGLNGELGQSQARDGCGVAALAWQTIWMVRENNELVICRATTYGGSGSGSGAANLDALTDVTLTAPANGNTLQYNSSTGQWVNVVPPGGTGGAPSPHAHSSIHHTGLLPWAEIDTAGSELDDIATRPHSMLTGISRDQHHPYVHDIISGDATFGPAHTIVGSALQVVGATATNTLGLITPSSNPGLAGAILRTDAQGGITIAGGLLAVTPATSKVTIDGSNISIDTSLHTLTIGEATTFNSTTRFNAVPTFNADVAFAGADHTITSPSGLDVTWNLGGDLMLDAAKTFKSTDFLDDIPIAGFSLFKNSGNDRQLTINTIKSDSLHTRLFVADGVRIDIGEERWGKSMGIVHDDFTSPATNGATVAVIFEDSPMLTGALFSNNDWLLFRYLNQGSNFAFGSVWGQVTGYTNLGLDADGRGYQGWTFTLRHGDTSVLVKKGNVAVDYGASGQGYAFLSVLSDANGPWFRIGQWFGSDPFSPGNTHLLTTMGNLNGLVGYSTNAYGFAAGNDLSKNPGSGQFSGFVAEGTTGLSLYNTDLTLYASDGLPVVELTRTHGVALRFDSAAFNDPLRYIGWFDDLNNQTSQPQVGLSASYSAGGGTSGRNISLHSYATDGTETVVDIFSSGFGGQADILMLSNGLLADNTLGGVLNMSAKETHLGTQVIVGALSAGTANARPISPSPFTVLQNALQTDRRAGMTIMQLNNLGDAVLHFNQRTYAATGDTFISEQWYSVGIDGSDSNKFKISASQSLGTADFFSYDLATGLVTVSGLSGGSGGGGGTYTAGPGLTLTGSQFSVDFGLVPHASMTIYTDASSGLTGGGDLTIDRHLSVLVPGSSGLQLTSSGVIINDTLAGAGLAISPTKIMSVGAVAGSGIQVNANDIAILLAAGSGLVTTSGLALASTVAGLGLTLTSGVLDVGVGAGLLRAADAITLDPLLAGAGLTLTAGVLAVGQGAGIAVAATTVAVALASPSGLSTTGGLNVADTLAGNGLTIAAKVLAVGAGTGIVVSSTTVGINTAANFTWNGTHQFNVDQQLNANLDFIGGERNITTAAAANLNILPAGDLVLNPTGTDVYPGGNGLINLGGYNRKWSTLYASELYVETLVASNVMATIGGRVMVTPTSSLLANFDSGDTTIDLKHNSFTTNTYLYLETIVGVIPQQEAIKLGSGPTTITGGYRYTVASRGLNGTAKNWLTGDAVVSLGRVVGDGYIDLASLQTIHSKVGPTITIYSRTATTNWNSVAPVVTMGNLAGFVGYGTEFGFATGNNLTLSAATGFAGFTADRTNGVRLFNTPLEIYEGGNKVVKLDKVVGLAFEYNNLTSSSSANLAWYDNLGDVAGAAPVGTILGSISVGKVIASTYPQGMYIQGGSIDISTMTGVMDVVLADSGLHVNSSTITDALVVLPNGKVGIGTSSPNAAIKVDIRGAGSPAAVRIGYNTTNSVRSDWQAMATAVSINAYNDATPSYVPFTIAANPIILAISNVEKMRVDSTGNVGIGVTNPGSALDLGTGDLGFNSNSAGRNLIQGNVGGFWQFKSNFDHILIQAGADDSNVRQVHIRSGLSNYGLYVGTNGRVGVGQASAAYALDVQANGGNDGIYVQNAAAGGPYVFLDATNATVANRTAGSMYLSSGLQQWMTGLRGGDGKLHFYDVASAQSRMVLLNNGQIGIGTTAPFTGQTVDIRGSGSGASIRLGNSTGNTQRLDFGISSTIATFFAYDDSVASWLPFQFRGLELRFLNASTEVARVHSNGNFGISNSAPDAKLDVAGVIRSTSSAGAPTTGTGVQIYYNSASAFGSIAAFTQPSTYRTLQADGSSLLLNSATNGQVGVATTGPVGQLGVEASAQTGISSTIYSSNFNTFNGTPHVMTRSARGAKYGGTTTLSGDSILAIEGYGLNSAGAWMTTPSVAIYGRASESYTGGQTNGGASLEIYVRANATAGAPAAAALSLDQAGNATINGNLTVNNKGTTDPPGGLLRVINLVQLTASGTLGYSSNNTICKPSASSRRFKKEIRAMPSEFGADFLMQLKPSIFKYKEIGDGIHPGPDPRDFVGLIAEDVMAAGGGGPLGSFVVLDSEGEPEGLRYDLFAIPLIATVQQQQGRIVELERKVEQLLLRLN